MERYQKIEKPGKLLGEGTYGQVYKAKDLHTGAIVALKRIKMEQEDEGVSPTALREIALLKVSRCSTSLRLQRRAFRRFSGAVFLIRPAQTNWENRSSSTRTSFNCWITC